MRSIFTIIILFCIFAISCEQKNVPVPSKNTAPGTSNQNNTPYSIQSQALAAIVYNDSLVVTGYQYVAQWTGSNWKLIGTLDNTGYSLAIYNGNLIVGGEFTKINGVGENNIAQWDGTKWLGLSSGINNQVKCLQVYNGNLIAGGIFTLAGGNNATNIAQWNGLTWSALGSGSSNSYYPTALTVYSGNLIVGYNKGKVASWNGTMWDTIASFNQGTGFFATFNGNLIMVGSSVYYPSDTVVTVYIEQWNGSTWSIFDSISGFELTSVVAPVNVYNGKLIGFENESSPHYPFFHSIQVIQWNGISWDAIGDFMNSNEIVPVYMYGMTVYNGNLFVIGDLGDDNVAATNEYVVSYNGSIWSALR